MNISDWARRVKSLNIIEIVASGVTREDEVVEIACISAEGDTIFNSKVNPRFWRYLQWPGHEEHPLLFSELLSAPSWEGVFREVFGLEDKMLKDKMLTLNADFTERLLWQTGKRYGLPDLFFEVEGADVVLSNLQIVDEDGWVVFRSRRKRSLGEIQKYLGLADVALGPFHPSGKIGRHAIRNCQRIRQIVWALAEGREEGEG